MVLHAHRIKNEVVQNVAELLDGKDDLVLLVAASGARRGEVECVTIFLVVRGAIVRKVQKLAFLFVISFVHLPTTEV
ncbi:hypothetical protein I4F81_009246 [Pyropia yezoensis]|uniref:Uncharacterized protein n=1 Tax=Pyropia yezoensis TaxID=2788 RepID=A0ACC3C8X3_PYRYE|nr:hypothetical protein I4F81_009246 [Neopyropia yezoensis]